MSVVEREQTTTVVLNPTPEQATLALMIEDVQEGRWCRDEDDDGYGRGCAVGLASRRSREKYIKYMDIIGLLDEAIPQGALDGYRGSEGAKINGGTSRGTIGVASRVCSFNNTAEGPEEIIAWFERAMILEA